MHIRNHEHLHSLFECKVLASSNAMEQCMLACNSQHVYIYLPTCDVPNRIRIRFHLQNTNNMNVPDALFWTQSRFCCGGFSQLNFTSDHEHVHDLRCTNIRLFFPFFETASLTASTITTTDIFRGPFLLNFCPVLPILRNVIICNIEPNITQQIIHCVRLCDNCDKAKKKISCKPNWKGADSDKNEWFGTNSSDVKENGQFFERKKTTSNPARRMSNLCVCVYDLVHQTSTDQFNRKNTFCNMHASMLVEIHVYGKWKLRIRTN